MDMNEITTNLVPFPGLHFLVPALAPLSVDTSASCANFPSSGSSNIPRAAVVRQLFHNTFAASHQLLNVDPKSGIYIANALLLRGELSISDVNNCMAKLYPNLATVHWNQDGFKVGLCSAASLHHPHAVLSLSNNTSIAQTFEKMQRRFEALFSRRAMTHHYTHFMGDGNHDGQFKEAALAVAELVGRYRSFERPNKGREDAMERFVPFV